MRKCRGAGPATLASLGVSALLAVALILVALGADAERPQEAPPVPTAEVAPAPVHDPAPDLRAVVLPPPPRLAPAPAPVEPAPVATPEPAPAKAAVPPPPEPVLASPPPDPLPDVSRAAPPPPPPPPATSAPEPVAVVVTPQSVREGRALLRLLERGEGPDIEIAWPDAAAERAKVYRLLNGCFGMRTVIMSADGTVFDMVDGRATAKRFDGDVYSGFVRRPSGDMSTEEVRHVSALRRHHDVRDGDILRLFPRSVDAIFLGSLQQIVGASFGRGAQVRARYRVGHDGVYIVDIRLDDRPVADVIALPFAGRRGCRVSG